MAQTYDELYALFNYNLAEGNLSGHMREFLDSVMGVYGGIYVFEGATEQVDPGIAGSKLEGWTGASTGKNMQCDYTHGELGIEVPGVYLGIFSLSFTGTTGSEVAFRLRNNGVESNYGCTRKLSSADKGDAGFIVLPTVFAAGDRASIYVECDGATDDVTPVDGQFFLGKIG